MDDGYNSDQETTKRPMSPSRKRAISMRFDNVPHVKEGDPAEELVASLFEAPRSGKPRKTVRLDDIEDNVPGGDLAYINDGRLRWGQIKAPINSDSIDKRFREASKDKNAKRDARVLTEWLAKNGGENLKKVKEKLGEDLPEDYEKLLDKLAKSELTQSAFSSGLGVLVGGDFRYVVTRDSKVRKPGRTVLVDTEVADYRKLLEEITERRSKRTSSMTLPSSPIKPEAWRRGEVETRKAKKIKKHKKTKEAPFYDPENPFSPLGLDNL